MKQKLIFRINILTISLLLFGGCYKKSIEPEVKYYMYNYYDNNWLLVRNAVIIKEKVLNDSISCLQITNHNRTVTNELGISVFFDKKLVQKTTFQGIYFSEDSINYDLFFDFNSGESIQTNFPVYYFYGIGKRVISLDTIKNYLKEEGEFYLKDTANNNTNNEIEDILDYKIIYQPKDVYYNYRRYDVHTENEYGHSVYYQISFDINLPIPLFSCDIIQENYYLLSEVIGVVDADKYINEAYEAVMNDKLRWSAELFSKEVSFPSAWWHKILNDRGEQKIKMLHQKGYSIHQIADSLNSTKDYIKRVLQE